MSASSYQVGGDHYRVLPYQPWDLIRDVNAGFHEGSIIKYMSRWRAKGGLQDVLKALHYAERYAEELDALGVSGDAPEGVRPEFPGARAACDRYVLENGVSEGDASIIRLAACWRTRADWAALVEALRAHEALGSG